MNFIIISGFNIMEEKLNKIKQEALELINSSKILDEIEEIRVKVLGRKGMLTEILRSLGQLTPELKNVVGKKSMRLKKLSKMLSTQKRMS